MFSAKTWMDYCLSLRFFMLVGLMTTAGFHLAIYAGPAATRIICQDRRVILSFVMGSGLVYHQSFAGEDKGLAVFVTMRRARCCVRFDIMWGGCKLPELEKVLGKENVSVRIVDGSGTWIWE